jgi:nitrate reductase alpha subunit
VHSQLNKNPLEIYLESENKGISTDKYLINELKSKNIIFSSEDLDNENNFPRNLFVWRSNLLGASGKGHEYFLKYLLGIDNKI